MTRLNTDRMRRHMQRDRQAANERAYRQKLAAMTPGHRAIHDKGSLCPECLQASIARVMGAHRGKDDARD